MSEHNFAYWPRRDTWAAFVREDLRANPRDPKSQILLVMLRTTQLAMGNREEPRLLGKVASAFYRVLTEFVLGIELRPKTVVGPGLRIYHGYGLVVNDHVIIGRGVTLRNGVTIGHQRDGGPVPVIGDLAAFGAGAIALGGIVVGEGAVIGAGSVVTRDVEPYSTVVGNPARKLSRTWTDGAVE